MGNLIAETLSASWIALAILAGLMVYFQVSISDPAAKKARSVQDIHRNYFLLLFVHGNRQLQNEFLWRKPFAANVPCNDYA